MNYIKAKPLLSNISSDLSLLVISQSLEVGGTLIVEGGLIVMDGAGIG